MSSRRGVGADDPARPGAAGDPFKRKRTMPETPFLDKMAPLGRDQPSGRRTGAAGSRRARPKTKVSGMLAAGLSGEDELRASDLLRVREEKDTRRQTSALGASRVGADGMLSFSRFPAGLPAAGTSSAELQEALEADADEATALLGSAKFGDEDDDDDGTARVGGASHTSAAGGAGGSGENVPEDDAKLEAQAGDWWRSKLSENGITPDELHAFVVEGGAPETFLFDRLCAKLLCLSLIPPLFLFTWVCCLLGKMRIRGQVAAGEFTVLSDVEEETATEETSRGGGKAGGAKKGNTSSRRRGEGSAGPVQPVITTTGKPHSIYVEGEHQTQLTGPSNPEDLAAHPSATGDVRKQGTLLFTHEGQSARVCVTELGIHLDHAIPMDKRANKHAPAPKLIPHREIQACFFVASTKHLGCLCARENANVKIRTVHNTVLVAGLKKAVDFVACVETLRARRSTAAFGADDVVMLDMLRQSWRER